MELIIDNGKPVQPSTTKKVMASLAGDNKMTMVFSHGDIQKIVTYSIWHQCKFLEDYKTGQLKHNLADNTYTLEFQK